MTDPAVQPSEHDDATSLGLLDRARARDQAAWQRLADLYAPLVARWCRLAGLTDADSADVWQEVLITVAARLDTFERRQEGSFRCWLRTITRTKIVDLQRARGAGQAEGGSSAQERLALLAAPASSEAPEIEAAEIDSLYRRALDLIRRDFEEVTWQAFWGVAVEGRAPAEIASERGITRNAVYLAKARVLKRLRDEFRDLIDD